MVPPIFIECLLGESWIKLSSFKNIWSRKILGKLGETIAVNKLRKERFEILEVNLTTRFGEIDIIAAKDNIMVFIEVKTRTSSNFGMPEESVGTIKASRIKRVAEYYLSKMQNREEFDYRFDIISVLINRSKLKEVVTGNRSNNRYRNKLDPIHTINELSHMDILEIATSSIDYYTIRHIKSAF